MVLVTFDENDEQVAAGLDVEAFLAIYGVRYEEWPVPEGLVDLQIKQLLTPEDEGRVLEAYRERLESEAEKSGYIQADMVVLEPSTPGLEEALKKFDKSHYHDDDEVRYIFAGEGIFGFEPSGGKNFNVTVSAGDYIVVPAKTYHWFTLTDRRSVKAIRLFKDTLGWVPHYKNAVT